MLTQEKIDKIFGILRIVHTSHWKAPKLEEVEREISRTGAYVFRAGTNPWVADIKITAAGVEYVVNSELPARMKTKADGFKQKFLELTSQAGL